VRFLSQEVVMLFAGIYTSRPTVSEASANRSLQLFTNWTPPSAFTFRSHYAFSDGTGGIFIAESTAEALLEATSPYQPFFEFKVVPIVDIMAAVPILQKVNAWRESVR
jgi:hypothetical protein